MTGSPYLSTRPKWTFCDPERYGYGDPTEGIVCQHCARRQCYLGFDKCEESREPGRAS